MNARAILGSFIAFGVLGIGLITVGWMDYEESRTASPEPSSVQLADLEAGVKDENNHVRVGPHAACYYATVYSFKKKGLLSRPAPDTPVEVCFYPILSPTDPVVKKIQELEKIYGSLDKVPDTVDIEEPSRFTMVVKTKRFKAVKDIPLTGIQLEPHVQGLILNRSGPLGYKETKLLRESFPDTDFAKVLVVEEGRTPSSMAWCFTLIGLGILSIASGMLIIVMAIIRRIQGTETEPKDDAIESDEPRDQQSSSSRGKGAYKTGDEHDEEVRPRKQKRQGADTVGNDDAIEAEEVPAPLRMKSRRDDPDDDEDEEERRPRKKKKLEKPKSAAKVLLWALAAAGAVVIALMLGCCVLVALAQQ